MRAISWERTKTGLIEIVFAYPCKTREEWGTHTIDGLRKNQNKGRTTRPAPAFYRPPFLISAQFRICNPERDGYRHFLSAGKMREGTGRGTVSPAVSLPLLASKL